MSPFYFGTDGKGGLAVVTSKKTSERLRRIDIEINLSSLWIALQGS